MLTLTPSVFDPVLSVCGVCFYSFPRALARRGKTIVLNTEASCLFVSRYMLPHDSLLLLEATPLEMACFLTTANGGDPIMHRVLTDLPHMDKLVSHARPP
jgi:hypothetical protein